MPTAITVIDPVFTDVNSVAHHTVVSINRDDSLNEIYVQTAAPPAQGGSFDYGIAVFNAAGTLLRSALINAGTAVPDTSVGVTLAVARGGTKIFGATPNAVFGESCFFVLNRTTLALIQNTLGGGSNRGLAVSTGESWAATFGSSGKIYNTANNVHVASAATGGLNGGCFTSDADLWYACADGTLKHYTLTYSAGIVATLLATYTPVAGGVALGDVTYLPNDNVLVLWYADGTIYLWDLGANSVIGSAGAAVAVTGTDPVSGNDKADTFHMYYANFAVGANSNVYIATPYNKVVNTYPRSNWQGYVWSASPCLYEPTQQNVWAAHYNTGVQTGLELLPLTNPAPAEPGLPPPSYGGTRITRTWTFNLDGHTFYVLDLYAQGTYVYDAITNHWAKFSTQGYTSWNMHVGTMWGRRIVAADIASNQVWELDPAAMTDEGFRDIFHACTGMLVTRSRVFQGVSALRVSASFGDIDEVANGATFNMRFSDDQGNTWSPYFSVALAENNFSGEVAWQSLGSFAAPGRVFELTDTGGLIRIDGCDAFLNDFDDPSNDVTQQSSQDGAPR